MRRLLATGLVLPRSSIPGERYDTALRKNFTPLLPNPVGKTITAVVFFFVTDVKLIYLSCRLYILTNNAVGPTRANEAKSLLSTVAFYFSIDICNVFDKTFV